MTLVSVVVPYYEQPEQLDLLVAALERQTWRQDRLELVVADDGSAQPPAIRTQLTHRVVHQEDLGFRAAAARNLGLRAAAGEIICFLDSDTIPEPEYVERSVAPVLDDPASLVVGRRLHRHLTGPHAGEDLPEPEWLRAAYARTDNLRDADDTSYRFVISAVLTASRPLLELAGGFDESFTSYGGEDWELAWRAWNAGAMFVHVPEAVAVHDGPDWAGRAADVVTKNVESERLARLITHPQARPAGVRYERTEVIADLRGLGSGPDVMLAAAELLRYGDITVLLDVVRESLAEDPRVVTELPKGIARSARLWVDLADPILVSCADLRRLVERAIDGTVIEVVRPENDRRPITTVRTTRSMARELNWGAPPGAEQITMALQTASRRSRLEAVWGGWA